MKQAARKGGLSGCQKSLPGSFDSLKNFFDFIEKVSDYTRKGGSPPPFHTFPPLTIQRVFSFFDTLTGRPPGRPVFPPIYAWNQKPAKLCLKVR